jgi:hypothetical protein
MTVWTGVTRLAKSASLPTDEEVLVLRRKRPRPDLPIPVLPRWERIPGPFRPPVFPDTAWDSLGWAGRSIAEGCTDATDQELVPRGRSPTPPRIAKSTELGTVRDRYAAKEWPGISS